MEVPDGFPAALPDDQLDATIREWMREYREIWPTSRLPELVIAFIAAGLQEQARRELVASTKAARRVLVVAVLTLLIAVATLFVAIVK
jgi:hypothetical protein